MCGILILRMSTKVENTGGRRHDWSMLSTAESSWRTTPNRWMYCFLTAGFLLRLWYASGTYLNPDEALHFFVANKTSWWLTYRASLTVSHPPLLIFLLRLWRGLGTSELMLRLPSILAGLVFCWLAFRWLRLLFDDAVVWTAFTFVIFLPSSIDLSTEVRQYALLLMFAMGSAYYLERALQTNSRAAMIAYGVFLWFALLSHFSAFLFAGALGIYAIWRMIENRVPIKLFAVWEFAQAAGLGICYWLYVTQISKLGQAYGGANATQGWMANAYLGNSYFEAGKINPLLFIFARTGGVFQYVFRQSAIGDIAFLLFVVGMVMIFRGRGASSGNAPPPMADRKQPTSKQLGTFLLLPFAFNCAAALMRAYPYGGTRHSAFLIPFAVAGVSVALVRLLRVRIAMGILVALVVSLLCNLFPSKRLPYMSAQSQSKHQMTSAIELLRHLPAGEPIFADYQTSLMIGHYLCDQRPIEQNRMVPGFASYACEGREVIVTTDTFNFTARSFYDHWQNFIGAYRLQPGTKICVVQMGWAIALAHTLTQYPEMHLEPHSFGDNIQIFELTVGQSMPEPARLPSS